MEYHPVDGPVSLFLLFRLGHWLLIPPERISDQPLPPAATRNSVATTMRERLKTDQGKELYGRRGCIVEPVFGRTKQCRGFRQFALRGKPQVRAEWALIAAPNNLLKLFACQAKAKSGSPTFLPITPSHRLPSPSLSNALILRTSNFLLRQTEGVAPASQWRLASSIPV